MSPLQRPSSVVTLPSVCVSAVTVEIQRHAAAVSIEAVLRSARSATKPAERIGSVLPPQCVATQFRTTGPLDGRYEFALPLGVG